MYHAVIINPIAGKNNRIDNYTAKFDEVMRTRGLSYGVFVTERAGHATALTSSLCEQHAREEVRFYACGGDGTLNEVLCGLAGKSNASLTHYPIGSGNDFIKHFDLERGDFLDIDRLIGGTEVVCDYIEGTHRDSINICTTGLDARIAADMNKYKRMPLIKGSPAYNLSVIGNLIKGLGEEYKVSVDSKNYDGVYSMIVVANASYYGGGFHPVPEALINDGLLDVLLVKKISRLKAASVIKVYKEGNHAALPDIIKKITATEITIQSEREIPINYDGEIIKASSVSFKLSQNKIRFVIPSSK